MNIQAMLIELEAEKIRIENAMEALKAIGEVGESGSVPSPKKASPKATAAPKKRRLSAAGRARIAAAAKARWARVKGIEEAGKAKKATKPSKKATAERKKFYKALGVAAPEKK